MRKKLFTLLLAVVASTGTMLIHAEIIDSGTFWTLDSDSVLTINKSGDMSDYNYSDYQPWYNNRLKIKRLIINEGVTSVGTRNFSMLKNLESVYLPESLNEIRGTAFDGCTKLSVINIPSNVTNISSSAFSDCTNLPVVDNIRYADTYLVNAVDKNLSNYTIKEGTRFINTRAFESCVNLSSVEIPNSVISVGSGAFYNCTSLTNAIIGTGVVEFGTNEGSTGLAVFHGCSNLNTIVWNAKNCEEAWLSGYCTPYGYAQIRLTSLTNVSIGPDVEVIPSYLFWGCTNLSTINFLNILNIKEIGVGAFYQCSSLKELTLPESVTYIGTYAFKESNIQTLSLPNSALTIDAFAFADTKISELTISENTQTIAACAFDGCTSLRKIYYNAKNASVIAITDSENYSSLKTYYASPFTGISNNVEVIIGANVQSLPSYLFAQHGRLRYSSGSYPSNWQSSSSYFPSYKWSSGYDYPKFTSKGYTTRFGKITFEEGSQCYYIGEGALGYCSDLTELDLPESLLYIDECAFIGCIGLTELVIPEKVQTIKESALSSCSSLKKLVIPSSAKVSTEGYKYYNTNISTENNYLYDWAQNLDSVTCPSNMFDIEETNWSTAPKDIKYICVNNGTLTDNAFAVINRSYKTLKTLDLSAIENTSLADEAFKGSYNLEKMYLPINLQQIGYQTFFECSTLKEITLPETVTEIGSKAFTSCDNLELVISNAVMPPTIASAAFDNKILTAGTLRIPCGSRNAYASSAWGTYFSNISEDYIYNVSIIVNNASMGKVAYDLDCENNQTTINATAKDGYQFIQWNDGATDNPRTIELTQDTTIIAVFAISRKGNCGNDFALTWEYDQMSKTLTISGNGAFDENMECGVEAKSNMEKLVIANGVTSIGENAFSGCTNLKHIVLGESVKKNNNNAFYNCTNLNTIYNYRSTPANAYSSAFEGVDKFECKLYVLPNSIDMYKAAAVWRDFYYTYAIGAEETTLLTNDVTIEPQDNAATVSWPVSATAETYTLQITQDGEVFCTLIFNGNGQLTGIAFAPGKNGNRHAPAAKMTANGMQFTVTGLNSATHYALTLQAKDDQDAVLASYSSEFTTTGTATSIDNTPFPSGEGKGEALKVLHNGQIFILRGEKIYTITGQEVK